MASRPKQKITTLREQNALLEPFYKELNEDDDIFSWKSIHK